MLDKVNMKPLRISSQKGFICLVNIIWGKEEDLLNDRRVFDVYLEIESLSQIRSSS